MSLAALLVWTPIFVVGWLLGAKWTRFKYGISKSVSETKKGFTDLFKKNAVK